MDGPRRIPAIMKRLGLAIELLALVLTLSSAVSCRSVDSLRAEWAAVLGPVASDALDRHDAYVMADPNLDPPRREAALLESSACRKAIAAADPPEVHRAWPRPRDRLVDYLERDPDLAGDEIGLAVRRLLLHNLDTIDRLVAEGLAIR